MIRSHTSIARRCLPLLSLVGVLVLAAIPVVGQVTWNGTAGTVWNAASNWTPNVVPGPLTNVVVPAGVPNFPSILSWAM